MKNKIQKPQLKQCLQQMDHAPISINHRKHIRNRTMA